MKKVAICTTSRNHLRFLIPIIETLTKDNSVLLYCNFSELRNDSYFPYLGQYENFNACDLSQRDKFNSFIVDANSLLVTTGSNSPYHKFEFDLCNSVSCKTFAIQHGLSQDGITRIPSTYFSADYVLTWVTEENIIKDTATPKEKFISVGVPNHFYANGKVDKVEGSRVFFFTSFFDVHDSLDIKIETSSGLWSGIYTKQWKSKTWDEIDKLCPDDVECFFVRHPSVENSNLYPKFREILKRPKKTLVDTSCLRQNDISRSELYSFGSKYYVTYPSSCWIDCHLNNLDYEVFVDYNSKVDVLLEDSLESINTTDKICKILLN